MRNIIRPSGVTPYLVKIQSIWTVLPFFCFHFRKDKASPTPCKFSISACCPTSGVSHVSMPSVCIPGNRKCKVDTWQKNMKKHNNTSIPQSKSPQISLNFLRAQHLTVRVFRERTHLPQRSQDLSGRTSAAGWPCFLGAFSNQKRSRHDFQGCLLSFSRT